MMMVNRRRVCGGKSLPYDTEIEYLESDGTQWIETGVFYTTTNDYTFIYDISFNSGFYSANGWNAGAFVGHDENGLYDGINQSIKAFEKRIYVEQNVRNKNANDTITKFSVDGNDYILTRTHPYLATYASNNPYPIFALYSQGSITQHSRERIYSFKVIINDILYRELIPVRKDGVGYMYDKVSGQLFGARGRFNLILGPDK